TIMRTAGIERIWIEPADVVPAQDAIAAIAEAEIVVLGPGSLYTSVLPVLLIPGIRRAVAAAPGIRVYVSNVATQPGETEGMDLAQHVEALVAHTAPDLIDLVIANDRFESEDAPWPADAVEPRWPPAVKPVPFLSTEAVASSTDSHHHDPELLAGGGLGAPHPRGDAPPPQRRGGAAP